LLAESRELNGAQITRQADALQIIGYLTSLVATSGIMLTFSPWSAVEGRDYRISDVNHAEWRAVTENKTPAQEPPQQVAGRNTQAEFEDLLLSFLTKLSTQVEPSELRPVLSQIQQRASFTPLARLFPAKDRPQATRDLRTANKLLLENPTPELLASLLKYVATPEFDEQAARLR
jgi:hypothetical protein